MPCIPALYNLLISGHQGIAGSFQMLLRLSQHVKTQESCAELMITKRKGMPQRGSMQRQAG